MLQDYTNYFRSLAIRHKDLQHDPTSETGDGPIGSMHFTKFSSDGVLKELRTGIGFPLLCLELYETETQAQSVIDIKLKPSGSFMIIDNPVNKSAEAEQDCYVKSEKILFDILKQIWQDHYGASADCNTPFKEIDFNNMIIQPATNAFSGQHGYRVVFNFELQKTYDITEAPEAGVFITD